MKNKRPIVHLGIKDDDHNLTILCGLNIFNLSATGHPRRMSQWSRHRWDYKLEQYMSQGWIDACKKCLRHPSYPLYELSQTEL